MVQRIQNAGIFFRRSIPGQGPLTRSRTDQKQDGPYHDFCLIDINTERYCRGGEEYSMESYCHKRISRVQERKIVIV